MEKRKKDPEFSKRLNKLLELKGIKNNNQFAKKIDKAPIVTLGWLKGKVPGYPEDLKLLCDFFGVSSDYLLFGKNGEQKKTIHISLNWDRVLAGEIEKFEERHHVRRNEDKLILLLLHKFLSEKISLFEGNNCEVK